MFRMGWKLRSGLYGPTHVRRLGLTFQWGYHPDAHTRWMLSAYLFAWYWVLSRVRKRWL